MSTTDRPAALARAAVCALAAFLLAGAALAGPKGEICYLRETDGFWQVWVMNGKGRKQLQVTRSPADKVRCSWTGKPGELLVATAEGELLRVGRESGEQRVAVGRGPILDAAALPDGDGLLYSMPGAGIDTDDVWLVPGDGAKPVRITREPFLEHFPVACPDCESLLYTAGPGNDEHDIYRARLEEAGGFQAEKLTRGALYNFEPSCSRTGAVAFSSNRSGEGNYEIWTMGADGAQPRRLTSSPAADTHPTWSPDERFIAFESTRDGDLAVYRLQLKRMRVRRLTPGGVIARSPVWSPR